MPNSNRSIQNAIAGLLMEHLQKIIVESIVGIDNVEIARITPSTVDIKIIENGSDDLYRITVRKVY